jgi:copper oxidase (laccase) domain-containing protein
MLILSISSPPLSLQNDSDIGRRVNIKYATFLIEKEGSHVSLNQTHSNNFCDHRKEFTPDSDGHIFAHDDYRNFLIKTADCMPIFIYGKFAAAFIHVGHVALRNNILAERALMEIVPIYAFIGPSICGKCYQVREGFDNGFLSDSSVIGGHKFFDLRKEACLQLAAYYGDIEVAYSDICTFEDKSLYSYRRRDNLRNFNVVTLKKEI